MLQPLFISCIPMVVCNRRSSRAAASSHVWATLQANCAINTLHIEAGRWAVVDWGSTGHLEGVGCLADAAGQSNFTLISLCERHLQLIIMLLQVGPRPEGEVEVDSFPHFAHVTNNVTS